MEKINLNIGDKFIVRINNIGGGIHFLKDVNGKMGYNLDYELSIFRWDKFDLEQRNLLTIITFIGDNKFQEYYSKRTSY